MPRFQRSRCTSTPRRALLWNAKLASSKAFGRWSLASSATWKARYFFQAATGSVSRSAAPPLIAETSRTTTRVTAPMPLGSSATCQSTAGIAAVRPARSIGLFVAFTSRRLSAGQWAWASFVSSAITVAALSAGAGSPSSSKMRVT